VDALRDERSSALRERRQSKTERTITLRGQIQQARVQLSHFARNRCSSLRSELQAAAAGLSRKNMTGFEAYTRGRAQQVVAEVADSTARQLDDVAAGTGVAVTLPQVQTLPAIEVAPPSLKSRKSARQETWLLLLLGAGFGLGVALTLSRVVAGIAPGLKVAGGAVCVAIGLAVTVVVVTIRGLLRDRAVLDRWAGDVTASLRSVVEEFVATRVLVAESVLSTAAAARDEAEHARVADQVSAIDSELREHAIAAARAAAVRDREMPAVRAALEAVRAELGDPRIPRPAGRGAPKPAPRASKDPSGIGGSAARSFNGDNF
jgi:hypothetical protein